MEHLDEHEMMVEYSEMTSFDFNSEEFQKIKNDYVECKNFVSKLAYSLVKFVNKLRPISSC